MSDVAGVDLGSNSFHLVIARPDGHRLRIVDKEKETVRLAAGLVDGRLAPEARSRALATLRRFGDRIRTLPANRVRAVGTNTFRAAKNAETFIAECEDALGHELEIVSGAEEARLVYAGVAHTAPPVEGRRLVVDIGGGSTEVIIGQGHETLCCHSLRMGCVTFTDRFFGDGQLTKKAMRKAREEAEREITRVSEELRAIGFDAVTGTSGTIRAIEGALREQGWSKAGIDVAGLDRLGEALVDIKKISKVDLDGVSSRRQEVIGGGFAILRSIFEHLEIERMHAVDGALREGLIYELVDREAGRDIRTNTIEGLQKSCRVDLAQAERVTQRFVELFDAVADTAELDPRWRRYGTWAAQLHEAGTSIAHSSYHKHGAYLLQNTVMPGFSQTEQNILAAMVLCHRRKYRHEALAEAARRTPAQAVKAGALLRLAVRLERYRSAKTPRLEAFELQGKKIRLELSQGRPLLRADLEAEAGRLARADLELNSELLKA